MAVRLNIGKITNAIQEGRRAYSNIDFGPEIPSSISIPNEDGIVSDFGIQQTNPDIFIAGISKWARPNLKVTK